MTGKEKRDFYRVGVLLFIEKGGKVLLGRRKNTGYMDGRFCPPGGHLDMGESLSHAAAKEAKEEIGISIAESDLKMINVVQKIEEGRDVVLIFTMKPRRWRGRILNMEPDRCSELRWFRVDRLPKETIPYVRHVIKNIRDKVFYSEYGW